MTDDQSPEQNPGSGRLWTQPREEDEHTQWLAPRTEVPLGAVDRLTASRRRRTTRRRAACGRSSCSASSSPACCSPAAPCSAPACSTATRAPGSTAALPASPGGVAPDARARAVRSIVADAGPSVVLIRSQDGGGSASGTGFVIDTNGTIVTNAHVVEGASQVQVRFEDTAERVDARGPRHRRLLRPRRAARRRLPDPEAQAAEVRGLRQRQGRRHRAGDRLSARPRPDAHAGHRLRGRRDADQVPQRLLDRQGHPDRRPDQPRQLRRPAARRAPAA